LLCACGSSSSDDGSDGTPSQGETINGWHGYVAPKYCNAKTGNAGDDVALCAPAPSEGIQIHFGPSNYDDPAEVAKFMLKPGEEVTECAFMKTPSDEGKFFGQYIGRSRPGSHHLQLEYAAPADKNRKNGEIGPCGSILQTQFIAIAQTPSFDIPDLEATEHTKDAPEGGGLDLEGSAAPMEPGRMMEMTAHFINTTDKPILREAWINLYFQDPAKVKQVLHPIAMISLGINVKPHSTGTLRRACTTPVDRKVKYLQGHSHVGTQRFSIWHAHASDGSLDKIYESYDPLDPALINYEPFIDNEAPDAKQKLPGGSSGELMLKAGDSLVWECEFENKSDVTVTDGDPLDGGQMCYTFGGFAVAKGEQGANWQCFASSATKL
jgi:hypothetical protein